MNNLGVETIEVFSLRDVKEVIVLCFIDGYLLGATIYGDVVKPQSKISPEIVEGLARKYMKETAA